MVKSKTGPDSKVRSTRRKPQDESVAYDIGIEEWNWSYSFGVSHRLKEREDPYDDFRHLYIRGTLIRPTHIKSKKVTVVLIPNADLNQEKRLANSPTAIGSIAASRGAIDVLLSIPADVMTCLLALLAGDKFKFVSLEGSKLHYGQGRIKHLSLDMTDTEPV